MGLGSFFGGGSTDLSGSTTIRGAQVGGEQLPEDVPQGSRQIGTLDGQPVFETPDGRRLVAE